MSQHHQHDQQDHYDRQATAQSLLPLSFPLHGSRLIEASAGTGKTWTIAALYLRLIVGHGGENGYAHPVLPSEILVMTFTRAATRELSDRIRQRLLQAAACFRGDMGFNLAAADADDYLRGLVADYPDPVARALAATRLAFAAESMDEASIFTIDAWCQRMLREHAFDSGSLFDEELVVGQQTMFDHAVHDYWRRDVYPLSGDALAQVRAVWPEMPVLHTAIKDLVARTALLGAHDGATLAATLERALGAQRAALRQIKLGWAERAQRMENWILAQRERQPKCFNGNKLKPANVTVWFEQLRLWAASDDSLLPWPWSVKAWDRLTVAGMEDARSKDFDGAIPDDFAEIDGLKQALAAIEPLKHIVLRHAAHTIAQRIADLKQQAHQFGFDDLLSRLRLALEGVNGEALRQRIVQQFPIAMIDEFQDTSPDQYRIFDLLYRVADNDPATGLFLIGDPKQAIYGFRGADIHSYLRARAATAGRHYQLATNFRSTDEAVQAVNRLFLHAEGHGDHAGHARGAFGFRADGGNPLPFEPVAAKGRKERFMRGGEACAALTVWSDATAIDNKDTYHARFAEHCADHIAASLNDDGCGFLSPATEDAAAGFQRLQPADIAILVRDRIEAGFIRRALRQRGIASVYLSDNDSVFKGALAVDVSRWLQAVANPDDMRLAHAAIATATAALPLPELLALATDDVAWERWIEQLKNLRLVWQRQGVLAMMRRLVHALDLPAKLLRTVGGERRLTDLLHLSELLQAASQRLDGEHALVRWLAGQIEGEGDGDSDERTLRLESDAELVKVVTVHKSKGLEYPLVYLPFAVSFRAVSKRRAYAEFTDAEGRRQIDFSLSDAAMEAMSKARLEEDLRLMYVAVTRARFALWLGVASVNKTVHLSALGYLLAGGAEIPEQGLMGQLQALARDCASIRIDELQPGGGRIVLTRQPVRPALVDAPVFAAKFERNWSIASYTSITRALGNAPIPATALQEKLLDHDDNDDEGPSDGRSGRMERGRHGEEIDSRDDAPWHRFPRGPLPGQFLHEQLEWLATEGFATVHDARFDERVAARCVRAGWGHRQEDTAAWLRAVATVPLPPLGVSLSEIAHVVPEMEFWFPTDGLRTKALDALCRTHLLDGLPRGALAERELSGMLKGYADLIFVHEGRYWVLDYKSNALGAGAMVGDDAYRRQSLMAGMAAHRYEVQGLIYLLALHRLLGSRLGTAYDPATQLGGALFYFIRGVGNHDTAGCFLMPADIALLDAADALLASSPGATA